MATTAQSKPLRWRDRTFPDALAEAAVRFADRVAVVEGDDRLTYAQLWRRVEDFALGLHGLGIGRGDHVALWLSDSIEWAVARFAVPSLGAVLVPVNTRLRGEDLRYILDQSDSIWLIMDAARSGYDYLATLADIVPDYASQSRGAWRSAAVPKIRGVIAARGGKDVPSLHDFAAVEAHGRARRGDGALFKSLWSEVRSDDVAQLLYTSGTTSLPKAAMVCHGPLLENNFHSGERSAMTERDAYLLTVPSFSASGVAAYCQCLTHGAALVLMERFSAEAFCVLAQRERATVTFLADPIVYDLRNFKDRGRYDLSSLRAGAGAPLSDASFAFAADELRMPAFGHSFGMSETSNVVSRAAQGEPREVRQRANGRPQPDVIVEIVDPHTDEVLPPDTVGEIRISGYTLMRGYYNKAAETAAVFDAKGRLRSGDLGMLNRHGELVYTGRNKEMVKVGGFNIAPSEIEAFLETMQGVARAAVVAVPHERLTEVPFAFVELEAGATGDADALLGLCRGRIADYKLPRFIAFEGNWPMTQTQKVQKTKLRERALALISSGAVRMLF